MKCTICKSDIDLKLKVYDDRYGYPGLFSLMQCRNCGHIFLDSNFTGRQLTDLYTNYYPRAFFNVDNYEPVPEVKGLKSWLNGEKRNAYAWVPKNVTVLDIGCGFGETLGYHTARGCNAFGVEVDENIKRTAQKYGFKVHVGLFDSSLYDSDFFDFVTMDQVIEHVKDPIETLKGITKILKQDGVLILSFPNANGWGAKVFGERWINWHAPYHLNFFTRKSLSIIVREAGLKIDKTITLTSSEWLYYQLIHLFLFPKAGVPSVFWKPGQKISSRTRIFLKFIYLIHKIKITHLITRLFDSISLGDGYLVFLKKSDE
jgi:SAM-dependent methyltransferase